MLLKLVLAGSFLAASGCGTSSKTSSIATEDAEAEVDARHDGTEAGDEPGADGSDSSEAANGDVLEVFPAQFTTEGNPMRMLAAGDPVDLWSAPQGGHVVLFGAKVRNMTSDTANIRARFRRPSNGFIVAEDGRTVKMVPVPGEPGVMQPDIRLFSQVANVPLCPTYGPSGIVDEEFDVEIRVTALYTDPVQAGEAKIRVVARCSTADDEAHCRCDCGPDYFLGKCSFAKGGSDAGELDTGKSPGD